jgi:hypothetical protein
MSTGTPIPPPDPRYPYVPPPPVNSGNTVVKIVLIVVGVFVLLGVIAAGVIGFGAYKLSKTIQRDNNGNVSISTPDGTITTGKTANVSATDLGVDPYPGAEVSGQGSMNMKTPNGSMVTAGFTSTDSPDKIVAFYKDKLGAQASLVQSRTGTVISNGEDEKNKVMITITPQGSSSKIVIIHITDRKSQ